MKGEVTLCLNGHILKGTGRDSVISVQNGADFTLCDCNGSQSTRYHTVDEDGLYIFDGVTAAGSMVTIASGLRCRAKP